MQDPRLKVKPNTHERKQIKEMIRFKRCTVERSSNCQNDPTSARLAYEFRPFLSIDFVDIPFGSTTEDTLRWVCFCSNIT